MCIGSQYDSLTHSTNRSLAMAEMQIAVAAIYRKYYTKICSMMNDAMMEVDDGITSAGPVVRAPHQISSNHGHYCYMEFHDAKDT
jgi:hypothetical protein